MSIHTIKQSGKTGYTTSLVFHSLKCWALRGSSICSSWFVSKTPLDWQRGATARAVEPVEPETRTSVSDTAAAEDVGHWALSSLRTAPTPSQFGLCRMDGGRPHSGGQGGMGGRRGWTEMLSFGRVEEFALYQWFRGWSIIPYSHSRARKAFCNNVLLTTAALCNNAYQYRAIHPTLSQRQLRSGSLGSLCFIPTIVLIQTVARPHLVATPLKPQ